VVDWACASGSSCRRCPRLHAQASDQWDATYRTEKVEKKDLRVTVSATGTLQTLKSVDVGAEVTGRILRILVDYNDSVKQGQLLAEIDPEQLRAAEEQARAQVLSAESSIKTAEAAKVSRSMSHFSMG